MARKGISYDQVANAARAIKARGQEPTIAAVRVECGNEGSFTTISAHIAKWRNEEADKVETRSLPAEVEDAMMEAQMKVWNIANKAATADILAIKQENADERKKLVSELDEYKVEISKLEEENDQLKKQAQEQATKAAGGADKLAKALGELEATKELYKQLLNSLKQPSIAAGKKGADTKPALVPSTKPAPENKQAGTQS